MEKGRIVVVLVLVVAGAGLLAYGLFRNSIAAAPKPAGAPAVAAPGGEPNVVPVLVSTQPQVLSEPAATQEVARGGLTRDESGQIQKTYEGKEAPKACPT
ncbi:MAG: hypothetical protein MUC88_01540 [Planctomycetes bacterium]|jgi:hypothetical protein|nr:hypothetical protein [Planctomycetota bacterium]